MHPINGGDAEEKIRAAAKWRAGPHYQIFNRLLGYHTLRHNFINMDLKLTVSVRDANDLMVLDFNWDNSICFAYTLIN